MKTRVSSRTYESPNTHMSHTPKPRLEIVFVWSFTINLNQLHTLKVQHIYWFLRKKLQCAYLQN
jgi:hypothetical protein